MENQQRNNRKWKIRKYNLFKRNIYIQTAYSKKLEVGVNRILHDESANGLFEKN